MTKKKIIKKLKEHIEWLQYYRFQANPVKYRPKVQTSGNQIQVTELIGDVPSSSDFLTEGEIAGLEYAIELLKTKKED